MNHHFTPSHLATYVAKQVPANAVTILEPCAGEGDLIAPLIYGRPRTRQFTCIDRDRGALARLRKRFAHCVGIPLDTQCTDFLRWELGLGREKFDCVVMNPPFSARRSAWLQGMVPGPAVNRKAPPEAVFVLKGVSHLRDGGTLVGILPSSLVAGSTMSWVREFLRKEGRICLVHELPPYVFRGVEAQFYVLVFRKGRQQAPTILLNHSLHDPERCALVEESRNPEFRLDFSFSHAISRIERMVGREGSLNWVTLGSVASIVRGNISAPFGEEDPLHTWDYQEGFWKKENVIRSDFEPKEVRLHARDGDLLVSRVGRNSSGTIGLLVDTGTTKMSDCLLRIRPRNGVSRVRLLLAIRSLYSIGPLSVLIERGTGAKYISSAALRRCLVPMGTSAAAASVVGDYGRAVRSRDIATMLESERMVREQFLNV